MFSANGFGRVVDAIQCFTWFGNCDTAVVLHDRYHIGERKEKIYIGRPNKRRSFLRSTAGSLKNFVCIRVEHSHRNVWSARLIVEPRVYQTQPQNLESQLSSYLQHLGPLVFPAAHPAVRHLRLHRSPMPCTLEVAVQLAHHEKPLIACI